MSKARFLPACLLLVVCCGSLGPAWVVAQESSAELLNQAYQLSRTAKTAAEYSKIIELCEQGIPKADEAGQAYAKKLMAWSLNRRGQEMLDANKIKEAQADFDKAIVSDPTLWRAYHNRGFIHAGFGNYDAALADFDKTLELSPRYDKAYFNRGEIYYLLGKYEEAAKDYTKSLELSPNDSEIYNRRGYAYYQLGKRQQAAADYNRSVALDPKNVSALINRGDMYGDLGQLEQAAIDYRAAINADPNSHRAYVSAAWMMSTSPDARFRNPQMALQSASRALELLGEAENPYRYRYLETLAAAQANAGQFKEAIATLQQALELALDDDKPRLQAELKLYQANQPFRDSKATANAATPETTPNAKGPTLGNVPQ